MSKFSDLEVQVLSVTGDVSQGMELICRDSSSETPCACLSRTDLGAIIPPSLFRAAHLSSN